MVLITFSITYTAVSHNLVYHVTEVEPTISLVFIFIGALAVTGWYVEYELPSLVRGLQCDGNERAVLNCSTSLTSGGSCSASSDASVICPGMYAFYYIPQLGKFSR